MWYNSNNLLWTFDLNCQTNKSRRHYNHLITMKQWDQTFDRNIDLLSWVYIDTVLSIMFAWVKLCELLLLPHIDISICLKAQHTTIVHFFQGLMNLSFTAQGLHNNEQLYRMLFLLRHFLFNLKLNGIRGKKRKHYYDT